jgi:hypothetical protein
LQRATGAAFLLTVAALVVFWTVKGTKPSGDAVLPILYAVLVVSALTWLATEVVRLRRERSRQRTGNAEMNRLIRRQYRRFKRRRLMRRLLGLQRESVSKEQRLMETTEPPPFDHEPVGVDQDGEPSIARVPSALSARFEVGRIHEQHLQDWLAGIARSVSQDNATGYAGFPGGTDQDNKAVAAHFPDLIPRLVEWDEAVARAEAAPIAAREQVERAVLAADISADYNRRAIAAIIARFVTVASDYRIVLRAVRDDFREDGVYWSVFTMSGRNTETKVAQWDDAPIESVLDRSAADEAALQRVVDDVRDSDLIPEISASRDALEALKQPLLNLLDLKRAVAPILFSADCSYCDAQLQSAAPVTMGSGAVPATFA